MLFLYPILFQIYICSRSISLSGLFPKKKTITAEDLYDPEVPSAIYTENAMQLLSHLLVSQFASSLFYSNDNELISNYIDDFLHSILYTGTMEKMHSGYESFKRLSGEINKNPLCQYVQEFPTDNERMSLTSQVLLFPANFPRLAAIFKKGLLFNCWYRRLGKSDTNFVFSFAIFIPREYDVHDEKGKLIRNFIADIREMTDSITTNHKFLKNISKETIVTLSEKIKLNYTSQNIHNSYFVKIKHIYVKSNSLSMDKDQTDRLNGPIESVYRFLDFYGNSNTLEAAHYPYLWTMKQYDKVNRYLKDGGQMTSQLITKGTCSNVYDIFNYSALYSLGTGPSVQNISFNTSAKSTHLSLLFKGDLINFSFFNPINDHIHIMNLEDAVFSNFQTFTATVDVIDDYEECNNCKGGHIMSDNVDMTDENIQHRNFYIYHNFKPSLGVISTRKMSEKIMGSIQELEPHKPYDVEEHLYPMLITENQRNIYQQDFQNRFNQHVLDRTKESFHNFLKTSYLPIQFSKFTFKIAILSRIAMFYEFSMETPVFPLLKESDEFEMKFSIFKNKDSNDILSMLTEKSPSPEKRLAKSLGSELKNKDVISLLALSRRNSSDWWKNVKSLNYFEIERVLKHQYVSGLVTYIDDHILSQLKSTENSEFVKINTVYKSKYMQYSVKLALRVINLLFSLLGVSRNFHFEQSVDDSKYIQYPEDLKPQIVYPYRDLEIALLRELQDNSIFLYKEFVRKIHLEQKTKFLEPNPPGVRKLSTRPKIPDMTMPLHFCYHQVNHNLKQTCRKLQEYLVSSEGAFLDVNVQKLIFDDFLTLDFFHFFKDNKFCKDFVKYLKTSLKIKVPGNNISFIANKIFKKLLQIPQILIDSITGKISRSLDIKKSLLKSFLSGIVSDFKVYGGTRSTAVEIFRFILNDFYINYVILGKEYQSYMDERILLLFKESTESTIEDTLYTPVVLEKTSSLFEPYKIQIHEPDDVFKLPEILDDLPKEVEGLSRNPSQDLLGDLSGEENTDVKLTKTQSAQYEPNKALHVSRDIQPQFSLTPRRIETAMVDVFFNNYKYQPYSIYTLSQPSLLNNFSFRATDIPRGETVTAFVTDGKRKGDLIFPKEMWKIMLTRQDLIVKFIESIIVQQILGLEDVQFHNVSNYGLLVKLLKYEDKYFSSEGELEKEVICRTEGGRAFDIRDDRTCISNSSTTSSFRALFGAGKMNINKHFTYDVVDMKFVYIDHAPPGAFSTYKRDFLLVENMISPVHHPNYKSNSDYKKVSSYDINKLVYWMEDYLTNRFIDYYVPIKNVFKESSSAQFRQPMSHRLFKPNNTQSKQKHLDQRHPYDPVKRGELDMIYEIPEDDFMEEDIDLQGGKEEKKDFNLLNQTKRLLNYTLDETMNLRDFKRVRSKSFILSIFHHQEIPIRKVINRKNVLAALKQIRRSFESSDILDESNEFLVKYLSNFMPCFNGTNNNDLFAYVKGVKNREHSVDMCETFLVPHLTQIRRRLKMFLSYRS